MPWFSSRKSSRDRCQLSFVCSLKAALFAVRDIALADFGMILIREVADAPVIMGISKPAGLKSPCREVKK